MLIKGIYNFCQIKNGEFLNSCHEKTVITKKITFIFLLIVSGRNPRGTFQSRLAVNFTFNGWILPAEHSAHGIFHRGRIRDFSWLKLILTSSIDIDVVIVRILSSRRSPLMTTLDWSVETLGHEQKVASDCVWFTTQFDLNWNARSVSYPCHNCNLIN